MMEPAAIVAEVEAWFQPKALSGRRVLVTAGPTEEPIDPVRVITNSSSGKMGFAVARAAREAGAQVTLVSGPVALETPAGVARVNVRSAAADVRRGEVRGEGQRHLHFGCGGRRLESQESLDSRRSRKRTAARRRSNSRRTRTSSPGWRRRRTRRSASASPPRARTSTRTRRHKRAEEGRAADRREPRAGRARRGRQRASRCSTRAAGTRSAAAPSWSRRASWSRTSPAC